MILAECVEWGGFFELLDIYDFINGQYFLLEPHCVINGFVMHLLVVCSLFLISIVDFLLYFLIC